MNRTSTTFKSKKDLHISEIEKDEDNLKPSEATLRNIMQFAASYRVVHVSSDNVISVMIN